MLVVEDVGIDDTGAAEQNAREDVIAFDGTPRKQKSLARRPSFFPFFTLYIQNISPAE